MQEQLDRIEKQVAEIKVQMDKVYKSSEKTRTYLTWGFWITIGAIFIPLIILPALIPAFLSSVALPAGF